MHPTPSHSSFGLQRVPHSISYLTLLAIILQAKWAETRLAQEQEESERLRKSASEEKLHAEAAIRDLSIGVAEMLSRPANRKAWPPEIAEVGVGCANLLPVLYPCVGQP